MDDLKGLSVRFINCVREHHYEHEDIIGGLKKGSVYQPVSKNRNTQL